MFLHVHCPESLRFVYERPLLVLRQKFPFCTWVKTRDDNSTSNYLKSISFWTQRFNVAKPMIESVPCTFH
jgi:hypothetical protein